MEVKRYKAIVIPYVKLNDCILLLMFRDRKSGDLTFICGGKKQSENFIECAYRELEEESRGTLNHWNLDWNIFSYMFQSDYIPPNHIKKNISITTQYAVYVTKTTFSSLDELKHYRKFFQKASIKNKAWAENDDVVFVTPMELLQQKYRIWDFMQNNVVPKILTLYNHGLLV